MGQAYGGILHFSICHNTTASAIQSQGVYLDHGKATVVKVHQEWNQTAEGMSPHLLLVLPRRHHFQQVPKERDGQGADFVRSLWVNDTEKRRRSAKIFPSQVHEDTLRKVTAKLGSR